MNEEETEELLKFLRTDYGRGYLAGLVNGISIILKILKRQSKYPAFIKLFWQLIYGFLKFRDTIDGSSNILEINFACKEF